MRGRVWAAIAVLVLLFVGAYAGSPYWAARQFRAAALSGDVDRLDAAVDFPAVRQSLKGQVTAAATRRMEADSSLRGNPFAGLGMALMPVFIDRMIDAFVTPEGIAAMVRQGKVQRGGGAAVDPDLRVDSGYRGIDRFAVTVRGRETPTDQAPRFVFERRGLFTWKVIRLEIPDAAFAAGK